MRLAALYAVYNEEDYIAQSLASVYESVDRIVVCHTTGRPWHGPKQKPDGTRKLIKAFHDPAGKIKYIPGAWPSEAAQRNQALAAARGECDWGLVIDGDEIYRPEHLAAFKRLAEESPQFGQWRVGMNTYWKSPLWRIDPPEPYCPVILTRIREGTTFVSLRETNEQPVGLIPRGTGILYHFSYAKPSAKIEAKMRNFSHADEILPGWWENVWLAWNGDHDLENIHPTTPECYRRAVYDGPEPLPGVMAGHRYVAGGVNGLGLQRRRSTQGRGA